MRAVVRDSPTENRILPVPNAISGTSGRRPQMVLLDLSNAIFYYSVPYRSNA